MLPRVARFSGYADRFAAALARVDQGQRRWVDEPRIDSCHTVWFELHEDLLASLGIEATWGRLAMFAGAGVLTLLGLMTGIAGVLVLRLRRR